MRSDVTSGSIEITIGFRFGKENNGRVQTHKKLFRGHKGASKCFLDCCPSSYEGQLFHSFVGSKSLFFFLALPLDILAMCAFIGLNVLETTLAVSYGIELCS